MDGGMRPNFPPRFDGPPDFFRGPPRMHFDDQFLRHRRDDGRRMSGNVPPFDNEHGPDGGDRTERRNSRWSMTSPKMTNDSKPDNNGNNKEQNNVASQQQQQQQQSDDQQEQVQSNGNKDAGMSLRGSTPLHDEPQDVNKTSHRQVQSDSIENAKKGEEETREINDDSEVTEDA